MVAPFFSMAFLFSLSLSAASHGRFADKDQPPEIWEKPTVIGAPVVEQQWKASVDLVNPPVDLNRAEPGQCLRFGVTATGKNSDVLLKGAKYGFLLTVDQKTVNLPPEPLQVLKRLKPENGDYISEALREAGAQNPTLSIESIAIPEARWCAPEDTTDSKLNIKTSVHTADGKSILLDERAIQIQTFATARTTTPFTDKESFAKWAQAYHFSPDPAQLLPGLRILVQGKHSTPENNVFQFFVSALKDSPAASHEMIRLLPSEDVPTRKMGVLLLQWAGYDVSTLLETFPVDSQANLRSTRLPDEFDATPDQDLSSRMDMLWADFFATGRSEPVRAIAMMLAWRDDYKQLQKLKKSKNPHSQAMPSNFRGAAYAAAGWSMNAISRDDGVLRDYIDALRVSHDVPQDVTKQLGNLWTETAFQKPQ